MNFTYNKAEKLKSKKVIDSLFVAGNSVGKYPLRLVFVEMVEPTEQKILMGVSVSKKYFKHAVDRNYFKRVLRECYRLNKPILLDNCAKNYAMMFFYQTKEKLTYQEIFDKTKALFNKFIDQEKLEEK